MENNFKIFTRYLKLTNLYPRFIRNLHKFNSQLPKIQPTPHNYILTAFFWDITKEGNDFWANESSKWVQFFSEYKREIVWKQIEEYWRKANEEIL